jgi:PPM family protein phosphatase
MVELSGNWNDALRYAVFSDIGMRRANNQDSQTLVLADDWDAWRRQGHLMMVADGMGAHAAGELASRMAVDGVPHRFLKYAEQPPDEALRKSIEETNREVHRRGQENTDFHNMGTTASVLLLAPTGAVVAHVGDSRVYRLRGDRLAQLTFDHSLVWEMQALSQLSDDSELSRNIPKNVITRSLGPNATVQVDLEGPFPLEVWRYEKRLARPA